MKRKTPKYRPKWCQATYSSLKKDAAFKFGRNLGMWWLKVSDVLATSALKTQTIALLPDDKVWIDLRQTGVNTVVP